MLISLSWFSITDHQWGKAGPGQGTDGDIYFCWEIFKVLTVKLCYLSTETVRSGGKVVVYICPWCWLQWMVIMTPPIRYCANILLITSHYPLPSVISVLTCPPSTSKFWWRKGRPTFQSWYINVSFIMERSRTSQEATWDPQCRNEVCADKIHPK